MSTRFNFSSPASQELFEQAARNQGFANLEDFHEKTKNRDVAVEASLKDDEDKSVDESALN